jgi:hypothetical protein
VLVSELQMLGVLVDNFFDLQAEGVFLLVVCRVCTDKSQRPTWRK